MFAGDAGRRTKMKNKLTNLALVAGLGVSFTTPSAIAQTNSAAQAPPAAKTESSGDTDQDLVRKLSNPVASLISVPLQNNFDFGAGPGGNGFQWKLNAQPVIPFSLNDNWNLVTRTIVPFIHQDNITAPGATQTGLGDTTTSFFFSPKTPGAGGLFWGVGPDLLVPTATRTVLGTQKWGLGPTGVVLQQQGGWSYGVLANQLWSFAGSSSRADVNQTFIQPFLAYATQTKTTFTLNAESTYDWEGRQWTVPLNAMVSELVRIDRLPVSFQVGGRYYADRPLNGPVWGLRFTITLIFPK
jgi:hypothetical protein